MKDYEYRLRVHINETQARLEARGLTPKPIPWRGLTVIVVHNRAARRRARFGNAGAWRGVQ